MKERYNDNNYNKKFELKYIYIYNYILSLLYSSLNIHPKKNTFNRFSIRGRNVYTRKYG